MGANSVSCYSTFLCSWNQTKVIGRSFELHFNKRSPEIGCITINEYVMQAYIDGGVELLMDVFVWSR